MTQSIRFDDWIWDPNTLELRNGSHIVILEPRVAQLFEYMVAHPGEILSRDRLVDAVWDGRVVSDEAVRRAVFSLRQAFAGGADTYIRTVHKKGYVASFPQPVAVDQEAPKELATAPDASASTQTAATTIPLVQIDASPARVATSPLRLRLAFFGIIAAIVLVAAGLTRVDGWWRSEPAPTQIEAPAKAPAALALLPFINFSEEEASELLANGLTEELFVTLERNPELRVTARSSAFQFKDQDRDVRDVGQRLGVRYVLSGTVRRSTDNVQVQAELLDIDTGTPLWTETYDRALADWFALQQDIALDVARAVQSVLQKAVVVAQRPNSASNAEAQLELLRARQLLITRSVADAEEAIEHLQRALTLDPNYALAYARLADAILIQAEATTGIKGARPVVAPLLDKALTLDPGLGEAYALRSRLTDDPVAAERDLRQGLELNPSYARGYELLANIQARIALQIPAAIETVDRAIALDPLTPGNYHAKAMLVMGVGKWEEAVELDRRALALNPSYRAALTHLSQVYGIQGYFADAIGYARRAVALDPRAVPLREQLILMYLAVGDIEAARAADKPPTKVGSLAIPWAEGNVMALADSISTGGNLPAFQMDTFMTSHVLLRRAVSDGDYGRAVALLSPQLLTDGALRPDVSGWGLYAYANLAQLLRLSGDITAASRLQEQIEKRMTVMESHFPPHRFIHEQVRAILLARAGRADEACAALDYSYIPNPRPFWRVILDNPAFDGMVDAPCLSAMRKRIEQYIATERERIDAMKREDDSAQPAPTSNDHSADPAT